MGVGVMAMDNFLRKLNGCLTTSDILGLLRSEAAVRRLGIKTIRYYRLRTMDGAETLVSVDCAGHDEHTSTNIRLGLIVKERYEKRENRTDGSFDVIDLPARPIVFQLEPELTVKFRLHQQSPFQFYLVKDDNCNELLPSASPRDPWVDVPLTMGGRVCGKLSCSLECGRVKSGDDFPAATLAKLLTFQELAAAATPYLETLRAFDVNSPQEDAMRKIFSQRTYEDLYKYLTTELRKLPPFNYEAADILVASRDTIKERHESDKIANRDRELLILRASSYPLAETWINRRYYRKEFGALPWIPPNGTDDSHDASKKQYDYPKSPGAGLTPWVWRTQKPIWLHEDEGDPNFERQLQNFAQTGEPPRWVANVPASDKIRSMLIVPVLHPHVKNDASPRRVLAVLRFVNREENNGQITPQEVVLLRRLAERCIGPHLLSLRFEVFTRKLLNDPQKFILTRLTANDDGKGVCKQLKESVQYLFPPQGKAVLLNLTDLKRETFRSYVIEGADESLEDVERPRSLANTLTKYILDSDAKFVFVNDLVYAKYAGAYQDLFPNMKCALGSAIRHGGDDYGVVIVLSEEYDLIPAAYGKLLHVIAQQLGAVLRRMDLSNFAVAAVRGVGHDIPTLHGAVTAALMHGERDADLYTRILEFSTSLIHAYTFTPPKTSLTAGRPAGFNIELAIQHSAEVALVESPTGQWKGRPWRECFAVDNQVNERLGVDPDFLNACLFNLFKNALKRSPYLEADERISVTATGSVSSAFLDVIIKNRVTTPLSAAECKQIDMNMALQRWAPSDALHPEKYAGSMGLQLVRSLAVSHSATRRDGRVEFGSLTRHYDPESRVMTLHLRLPVVEPQ